jgi:hypothetical protein
LVLALLVSRGCAAAAPRPAARPPASRSIISRTDVFQRALAAKRDFYREMAAYGEDYLSTDDMLQVGWWWWGLCVCVWWGGGEGGGAG